MPKARPLADRFAEKFAVNESGCWEWQAQIANTGYGCIINAGKKSWAHRVSWQLHRGQIPQGMMVLHRCDNPKCVNPEHLFLGTAKDNTQDMIAKGRQRGWLPVGEKNPFCKLSDADVVAIRKRRALGESGSSIAKDYGVTARTVYDVMHRSRKSVPFEEALP